MKDDITCEILALSQIYNNGTEITDDTTDRESLRLIALYTTALIKRKSQPAPFKGCCFANKLHIKATKTGQLFYELIQNILSLSRVTGNRRKLHPVIPLIVSLADKYHIHPVPALSEYYPDSEEDIKQLNEAYCEFIQSVDSKEYKTAVSTFKNSARKNYRLCCRYIENLFERHAKLLVVRTDLSYGKRVSHKVTAGDLTRHRIALYKAIQRLPLFKHCVGYILKLEYGREKGFHYHCLFFFNGQHVRQDVTIAQLIGEFWQETITDGQGLYFNCNRFKSDYRICGIGMLHRSESLRREGLMTAVNYICKTDQWVKLQVPGIDRTFWRGTIRNKRRKTRR